MDDELEQLRRLHSQDEDGHFVAFSGGAAMCLYYAASGAPVQSLTLIEPPWIGNDIWGLGERSFVDRFDHIVSCSDRELVVGFYDLFAPGFTPPVVDAELERGARVLRAVWRGYRQTPLDRTLLGELLRDRVFLPIGGRSTPRMRAQVRELGRLLPGCANCTVPEAHHFDIMIVGAEAIAGGVRQFLERKA